MVLGDFGDAGEGRFQYHARDLPLRRQRDGNTRSKRLAVDHEPVRRHSLATEKIENCGTVSDQASFARSPGVPAVAAVLGHQHPIPVTGKPAQPLGAVSDMAAIAMEICDDGLVTLWWQVPGEQRQP